MATHSTHQKGTGTRRIVLSAAAVVLFITFCTCLVSAQQNNEGSLIAWGGNVDHQCDVPYDITDVRTVAAGYLYSVALRRDGTVAAWGYNANGQCNVPPGLANVTAIDAGWTHSVALLENGTVVSWGESSYGETSAMPPGLTDVKAVAAGNYHSLALYRNGTVVGWGLNDYGPCTIPDGLTDVTAIATGWQHCLALRSNGTMVMWGSNLFGERTGFPSGLTDVTAIAAGDVYSLALRRDGTVVAWGYNTNGQCDVPPGLTNVTAIAAGYAHCLALRENGTIVGWGYNTDGQANVPSGLMHISAIAAGGHHSLAVRDLPPALSEIMPWNGNSTDTACHVVINGSRFNTTVMPVVNLSCTGYPNITATGVTAADPWKLGCTFDLSGNPLGWWDVTVTNPDGQSTTVPEWFWIHDTAPVLTSMSPNTGYNNGTIAVNITGSDFNTSAVMTVSLSGTPGTIMAGNVSVLSPTGISCTFDLNHRWPGTFDLVVRGENVPSDTLAGAFTLSIPYPPKVTSITPATGKRGKTVTITKLAGSNFFYDPVVTLEKAGKKPIVAKNVDVASPRKITCRFAIPAKAATGKWNVVVKNIDGKSGKKVGAFTVAA